MRLPPTDLPVEVHVDQLAAALGEHGHAVLQAEPGAGKTTVVPLRLIDATWLAGRRIVVLEPRRVAARAAARRMAAMLGEEPGQTVGWVTRDDRRIGPDTRIEIVTEGVLTGRMIDDPLLRGVGLVVFDEFHERSLPGDMGLALALHARGTHGLGARLLVMSATIDTGTIAALLGGSDAPAPVFSSEGRTHPVEIRWRPRKRADRLVPSVVAAVEEGLRRHDGDVLVFLPGVGEIRAAERALESSLGPDRPAIFPLHGSLPGAEQDAALVARAGRRIVLATDLAETSLTVEGVGVVVDAGLAREPRYDPRTGMTMLTTVPVSKASTEQRAGRAGRLGPGLAIRTWSKVEQGGRPPFRSPAITQVDLSGLVLDLARRGVTDPAEVPFLDAPPPAAWADAVDLLRTLGALDAEGRSTDLGASMASVPAHPRLARMIASGRHRWLGCLLAAILDDRDLLRGRPGDLPTDIAERVALVVDPGRTHPAADGRAIRQARDRAYELARRAGVEPVDVDLDDLGATLAQGFPERVARAKFRTPGGFVLADGRSTKIPKGDSLADAAGLVAVDLGIRPRNPIVNRAARLEARIDHLVYATPDLDATVAEIMQTWGLEPTDGGSHDGLGTRNALLGLGDGSYLEVIGPDPAQPKLPGPLPFGVDDLAVARLVTWAARVPDIDLWITWARNRGLDPGDPISMRRTTPDGTALEWRLTLPPTDGDGVLPFLIEWPGPTPAQTAVAGCSLMGLALFHDDPAIAGRLAEHAIALEISAGSPGLTATLFTPNGVVELRS